MRVTFLGHACHLVESGTRTLITDPWLCDSIFDGAVERDPPLTFGTADLPPIDAIVLSHGHLDHFNAPSLAALPDKALPVVVPATRWTELEVNLRRLGFNDVHALEDWSTFEVDAGLRVSATPSLGVLDECAYMIECGSERFWNGVDAPQPPEVIGEIARRYGNVDLAALSHNSFDQPSLLGLESFKPADHGPAGAAASARTLNAKTVIAAASNMRWRGPRGDEITRKVIRRGASDLALALARDASSSRLLDLVPGDAWSPDGGIERAVLRGTAPRRIDRDYIHVLLDTGERFCGPSRPSCEEIRRVHLPARLRACRAEAAYVGAAVTFEIDGEDPDAFSVDFSRAHDGIAATDEHAPYALRILDTDWKDLFERKLPWQSLLVSDRLEVLRYRPGIPPAGLHFAYALQALFP